MKYALLVHLMMLLGCIPDRPEGNHHGEVNGRGVSAVPVTSNSADSTAVPYKPDSLEQAYYDGKYYFRSIIRLKPNTSVFIAADSDYIMASVRDTAVRNLYFSKALLSPNEREAFYRKIVAAIPSKEIKVFEQIAALPEVREQAASSDGGLHTLIIWLTERPQGDDPYYSVEIKRQYYDRWGTSGPIGFVKIDPQRQSILVMDCEGNYLPLATWRHAPTRP